MTDLADKKCIPCEGGIPSFDLQEIHKYLKKVDGWDVNSENKKDYYIIKDFKFNNFLESQSFFSRFGIYTFFKSLHLFFIFKIRKVCRIN